MSEKEKNAIWIEQQRQGLLDQSLALEAELARDTVEGTEKSSRLSQEGNELA